MHTYIHTYIHIHVQYQWALSCNTLVNVGHYSCVFAKSTIECWPKSVCGSGCVCNFVL